MEAHVGTIGIGAREERKPRPHRFAQFRERLRHRRLQRAERAYSMRMNGINPRSIPGSEHAHLLGQKRF
jgi:hypothetical protein